MRFYLILLLTFFHPTLSTLSCPVFSCYNLDANICARYVSGSSFHINVDNCDPNYFCTATSALAWAASNTTDSTFWCQSKQSTSNTAWVPQNCPLQQRNKNFINLASVVTCTSDSDCQLQDGTYTTCICTISDATSGVCQPDINNQLFDGYWVECGSTRTIDNEVTYNFWMAYMKYYALLKSSLTCTSIFSDIQDFHNLYIDYKGASANAPLINGFPSTGTNSPTPSSNQTTPTTPTTPTPTGQSASCPVFSCSSNLSQNVCGLRTSSTTFQISSNSFSNGYTCSAATFWTWATKSTTASFPATKPTTTVSTTADFSGAPCYTKMTNKGFKSDRSLVTCSTSTDCQLMDGTYTDCHCTFRSDKLGVCEPDLSNDQVFGGYWKACGSDGKITDVKEYAYWIQYISSWVYLQSDLSCGGTFNEAQVLKELGSQLNGYTTLAATTLAVLMIIT